MGDTPSPPAAQSAGAATAEAVAAQEKAYPVMLAEQTAANLGQSYTDPNTGSTYDFTGLGMGTQTQNLLDISKWAAPEVAQQQVDLAKQYDPQRIDQAIADIKQYDPTRYALNQQNEQTALDQLKYGTGMTPDQERLVNEQVRSGQSARGNILGDAPDIQEAFSKFNMGQQLLGTREAAANAALGQTPASTQGGTLSGTQQGATAYSPTSANMPLSLSQPGAAQQAGLNYASSIYGTQMQGYNTQVSNSVNPWMSGLGFLGNMGAGFAGNTALFA